MADDKELYIIRKDFSGGQNNRIHGSNLPDNQVTVLKNIDIGVPGQRSKRRGLTLIESLSSNPGTGMLGFEPDGGTSQLVVTEGTNLRTWPTTGSFTTRKSDFTNNLPTKIMPGLESGNNDVVFICNGTDNMFRMTQAYSFQDLGNGSTSPPRSRVFIFYRNRLWVVDNNQLYWSSAFPSDYSTAFDRAANAFRMPIGTEQAIISVRDTGLIVMGTQQIWGINPSAVPAATDKPEKILDIGCVAGETAVQVGDDIYFLASDGVRGVFRTQQDKLQLGASYPISYAIKEEFESLSFPYITKSCAVYWDNKYLISVPTNASTYCNQVWVYYPATQGWMVITGWNVSSWSKLKVNGQERLYCTDSVTGKVYRAWFGFNDNGTAINLQEESKKEDGGQPLVTKSGGVLKVKTFSSGNYDLTISASIDDQEYITLGTMNLAGNAPTLPIALPFDLNSVNIIKKSFHLDSLGPWTQIRFKIQHNDLNGSDEIIIYSWELTTYADEYQSE